MINRRQYTAHTLTSGSGGPLALDTIPQTNATVLLFVTQAGSPGPVLTGPPTHPGVSYVLGGTWGSALGTAQTEWYLGYVAASVTPNFSISLANPADTYPVVVTAVEYTGLDTSPLDVSATNQGYSNTLFSGVTGATDPSAGLFVGLFASEPTAQLQTLPSDGFVGVVQTEVAAGGLEIRAGLWDRIGAPGGDPATVSTHTAFAVNYVGGVVSLVEDLSVTNSRDASLGVTVGEDVTIEQFLGVSIVDYQERSAALQVALDSRVSAGFNLLVKDDTFDLAAQLDVLVSPYVVTDLDALVQGQETRATDLSMYVTDTVTSQTLLSLLVTASQTLGAKLSVGVLAPEVLANSTTTPEAYVYRECRPLWCGVPQTKRFATGVDVWISDERNIAASLLNLYVVVPRVHQGYCDVSIA